MTYVTYKNIIYDIGTKKRICNKMITARRRKHLNPRFLAESAAFYLYFLIPVSDHDLKPSAIFFRKFACDLGFAGYVFVDCCPRRETLATELYVETLKTHQQNIKTLKKHKEKHGCSWNEPFGDLKN